MFSLDDYNYELPKDLIAQVPSFPADMCKLLYTQIGKEFLINDYKFADILDLINSNSVFFLNNTKVIKSRIPMSSAKVITKLGHEKIIENGEIFFLKFIDSSHFEALVRPGKKFEIGSKIFFEDKVFEVMEYTHEGRIIKIDFDLMEFMDKYGQMPLPPYIEYSKEKEQPYQSLFANKAGSVAAPTASLHFTPELISSLKTKGVGFENATLHIGLGTFKTVDCPDIRDYQIHSEQVEIGLELFDKLYNYKQNKTQVIVVGTTMTRILESLPYLWFQLKTHKITTNLSKDVIDYWDGIGLGIDLSQNYISNLQVLHNEVYFDTKLFIYPGFKYQIVDELITNFHLPKSSLLMLVSAFMGYENMKKAYEHAILHQYKFFSFGDSMRIKFDKTG